LLPATSYQLPAIVPFPISLTTLGTLDLRDGDGREIRPLLQQPKRLSLLLYLAMESPRRFQRRDSLLALFWPDLDTEHARAALRAYDDLVRRLAQELDIGPEPETQRLADTIRVRAPAPPKSAGATSPGLVAVEPFTVHGDPGLAYLGDGMMDLILTALDGAGD